MNLLTDERNDLSVKESVIIKSSRYGIHLILNSEVSFEKLLSDIKNKFVDSEKFFGEAAVVISFEGRELSGDEQSMIIDCISENTSIKILCIAERDEVLDEVLKGRIEAKEKELNTKEPEENSPIKSTFYRGTLSYGEEIAVDESIVIVGDVPRTASVVSKGSIIVLGALKGRAFAGMDEDTDSFIAALQFEPEQFNICGIYGAPPKQKSERQGLFGRKSAAKTASANAMIATLGDGFIAVSPLE
jgi:septum site-determining protein MinC